MKTLAVLLTCHNRKEKTLRCLKSLFRAFDVYNAGLKMSIFLTDDGCIDGTVEAVLTEFSEKEITILNGSGTLFWAGGMRNSWREALKQGFSTYLLLNDDTYVCDNVFREFKKTQDYCIDKFFMEGIYIGSTNVSTNSKEISYGGRLILNRWSQKTRLIIPNGDCPQECDLGNANIMFVSSSVVEKIGILDNSFVHGVADFDYTLKAKRSKIPVLVTPSICGSCENEHPFSMIHFKSKGILQRIKYSYSPTGLALHDNLNFYRRNFWYRYVFVFLMCWVRIILPSTYSLLNGFQHKV